MNEPGHGSEHYSMTLEWDPRDDIFIATVPKLPGCRTFGRTREDAVRQGQEVLELWINDARAHGDPIPPPRDFSPRPLSVRGADVVGMDQ